MITTSRKDIRTENRMMKIKRIIPTYIFSTVFIFAFDKIYALFGHGVSSQWMSHAYLYVLGLGAGGWLATYLVAPKIEEQRGFPLFYMAYNSGVAIVINAMLLLGIIEIAGGTSAVAEWYLYLGWAVIAAAVLFLITNFIQKDGNGK